MSEHRTHLRLFTPGPLNTTARVRNAMRDDWGSRTPEFIDLTARVRAGLLRAAQAGPAFTSVPLQGSGTFAVEAMLATLVPKHSRILVLANGAYGTRLADICSAQGIEHAVLRAGNATPFDIAAVDHALSGRMTFSHIAVVHCETSSGLINPVNEIAALAADHGCRLLVDAMSAFGALPLDYNISALSAVAASANKCLHGVPGIGFVLVRQADLEAATPRRSLSLDLRAQWKELEQSGQWRFTPPTHIVAALQTALEEFEEQGGRAARLAHYNRLHKRLVVGMEQLGFTCIVGSEWRAPMITAFSAPIGEAFHFDSLYEALARQGLSIYPGKVPGTTSFRIGCMGNLDDQDIDDVVNAIAHYRTGVQGRVPEMANL